jgi:hypothetical protein
MKKNFFLAIALGLITACNSSSTNNEQQASTASSEPKQQAVEFADPKYTDMGKKAMAEMSAGDINSWISMFSDSARYYWNNGDSLIGKTAINAYWTKRRGEVIDSISFKNDIWLPVKVNQPQQAIQTPGVWLLSWYQVTSKYKNGKSMSQWIHTDYHFDANDKVDEVVQYLDRAPINAALAK